MNRVKQAKRLVPLQYKQSKAFPSRSVPFFVASRREEKEREAIANVSCSFGCLRIEAMICQFAKL